MRCGDPPRGARIVNAQPQRCAWRSGTADGPDPDTPAGGEAASRRLQTPRARHLHGSRRCSAGLRSVVAELPWPVPPLGDEVVAMRPWRPTDVPAQLKAFSDRGFQRFSDWAPRTQDDALRSLAEQEHVRQRGEQIELALVAPHDDRVVLGGGSLHDVDLSQGRAAVGYWVAP